MLKIEPEGSRRRHGIPVRVHRLRCQVSVYRFSLEGGSFGCSVGLSSFFITGTLVRKRNLGILKSYHSPIYIHCHVNGRAVSIYSIIGMLF